MGKNSFHLTRSRKSQGSISASRPRPLVWLGGWLTVAGVYTIYYRRAALIIIIIIVVLDEPANGRALRAPQGQLNQPIFHSEYTAR